MSTTLGIGAIPVTAAPRSVGIGKTEPDPIVGAVSTEVGGSNI
jgi:hypothetical protein